MRDERSVADRFRLDGKVAIVTGGSRGIGRAVAEGLAEAGADIVIASRKGDACATAAREISSATGKAITKRTTETRRRARNTSLPGLSRPVSSRSGGMVLS